MNNARLLLARLDRIPLWPYPKSHMFIVGIGFFFAFYDILTIGLALPKIQADFHISLHVATWAITSSLIGYIIGSFIISRIADYFGRHLELVLSIICFTLGSLLSATSPSIAWLIIWRFLSGIGIGSEIVAVTTYMEELSPSAIRGKATSTAILYGMIGFAVVPFIALGLVPHFDNGWRILFVSGGIGGAVIFIMRRLLPDSPRWLVLHNRFDEAEKIITAAEQFASNKLQQPLPEPVLVDTPTSRHTGSTLRSMLQPPYGQRILLFVCTWFIYYIGNYAWLTLSPSLLIEKGFPIVKSISFVAIASLGFLSGSLLETWMGDRLERKYLAIIIALIWSLALLVIGFFPSPIVIMTAGFIASSTISMLIPLLYIYTGENFPTRIRATSLSVTDGLGHLGGAFCGQIIFYLVHWFNGEDHFKLSFIFMAVTGFLTAFMLLFGTKMTKQSLSKLV
jgi:putative MFS transporter